MEISLWFILLFAFMLIIGPFTQLLQLIAPELHKKLGLTEAKAFEPEFKWFLLEEKAFAIADMSFLITGLLFIAYSLLGSQVALILGLYTCVCYIYFGLIYITRVYLLTKHSLSPIAENQLRTYLLYAALFLAFGVFGVSHLWGLV